MFGLEVKCYFSKRVFDWLGFISAEKIARPVNLYTVRYPWLGLNCLVRKNFFARSNYFQMFYVFALLEGNRYRIENLLNVVREDINIDLVVGRRC
jgi:hypothetical protein